MTVIRANSHEERSAALLVRIKAITGQNHSNQIFDKLDTNTTKYIVIMENGHPISTCRLYPVNDETIMIDRIAVLPAYRNKGFKKIAVEGAEQWASDLGYKRIVIEKNAHISFAKELGYLLLGNQTIKYI